MCGIRSWEAVVRRCPSALTVSSSWSAPPLARRGRPNSPGPADRHEACRDRSLRATGLQQAATATSSQSGLDHLASAAGWEVMGITSETAVGLAPRPRRHRLGGSRASRSVLAGVATSAGGRTEPGRRTASELGSMGRGWLRGSSRAVRRQRDGYRSGAVWSTLADRPPTLLIAPAHPNPSSGATHAVPSIVGGWE